MIEAFQVEDHVDRFRDFDRLAIEQTGFVAPLANGFDGRLRQDGISLHNVHVPNCSVFGDQHAKDDGTFQVPFAGKHWIDGLHSVRQLSLDHTT